MRIQVSIAAAASMLALGSVGARAADAVLEPAPVVVAEETYDWSGLYVGVHGGYGHGRSEYSYAGHTEYWDDNLTDPSAPGGPGYEDTLQLYPEFSGSYSDQIKRHLDGALGGAQIGYNYQYSNFVFGAVADISAGNVESETASIGDIGEFSVSSKVDWFGTVRGRVGVASDRILFYGTGGFAYGRVKTSYDYSFDGDDYSGSSSETKGGWTLGGGIEYALTKNVTLSTEYLYVDLGKSDVIDGSQQIGYEDHYNGGGTWTGYTDDFLDSLSVKNQLHTVRVGLNYKF